MDKKILWVGLASLAIIALTACLTILFSRSENFRGTAYNEPFPPASNFELTRSTGEVFRLSDQRKAKSSCSSLATPFARMFALQRWLN